MASIFPSSIDQIVIFNASFGTRELDSALFATLRTILPCPWKVSIGTFLEQNRDDLLYCIICPAGLGTNPTLPKYFIVWQLEDLQGTYNNENYLNILRSALMVWDYSQFNVDLLRKEHNISAIYCPPGFSETITSPDLLNGVYLYNDQTKDIDILFLGYCDAYPRRILLREQCKELCAKENLKMLFVSDFDIQGMRDLIRRSRVCLNFAVWDVFVLAKIRLNILLSNQAFVISEIACDKDAVELYSESGMVFTSYENLLSETLSYLHKPEERRKRAIQSYQWYRKRSWAKIFSFEKYLPKLT